MKKWITILGMAVLISLVALAIWGNYIFKEAFGPKYRTVKITLDDNRSLIGKETYTADLAAVFYEVDFEIQTKKSGTYKLGNVLFSNQQWSKNIKLYDVADWIMLPVRTYSSLEVLLVNKITRQRIDTSFSSKNLPNDSLWAVKHQDLPFLFDGVSAKIDLIRSNKLYVNYEYRMGEPFKFYSETIEHKIDTATGRINTVAIYERKEVNPSNGFDIQR